MTKMRVVLQARVSGGGPGDVVDVPEARAQALLDGGFAVLPEPVDFVADLAQPGVDPSDLLRGPLEVYGAPRGPSTAVSRPGSRSGKGSPKSTT